jgi:hypothetical protein
MNRSPMSPARRALLALLVLAVMAPLFAAAVLADIWWTREKLRLIPLIFGD